MDSKSPFRHVGAFLAVATLMLTGCIQSESTVTVKPDGSGTIVTQTTMGGALVQMMQGMTQQLGGEAGSRPSNPLLPDEEKLKATAADFGVGVTFIGIEEINDPNGSVGSKVTYAFDNINAVKVAPEDAFGAMSELSEMSEQMAGAAGDNSSQSKAASKKDPITFSFTPGSPASLTINMPAPDPESLAPNSTKSEPTGTPDPTQLAMAQQMLGDMRFGLVVAVEGEVVESNATYQDGNNTTIFSMEMGKMLADPANITKMQALENEDNFHRIKNSLQDIDGMKFEGEEAITIKFQ
ncbi:MAG: hypothetical protein AAGD22_02985 [Verrucomicrobiota bacterium]